MRAASISTSARSTVNIELGMIRSESGCLTQFLEDLNASSEQNLAMMQKSRRSGLEQSRDIGMMMLSMYLRSS